MSAASEPPEVVEARTLFARVGVQVVTWPDVLEECFACDVLVSGLYTTGEAACVGLCPRCLLTAARELPAPGGAA